MKVSTACRNGRNRLDGKLMLVSTTGSSGGKWMLQLSGGKNQVSLSFNINTVIQPFPLVQPVQLVDTKKNERFCHCSGKYAKTKVSTGLVTRKPLATLT